ncbi:DUF6653 family protein [Spongiactinospora sp. TRM90649]|uniref:DUF6653 family protein n=1 Tax=Spongiactinospora sp. TRM90649 TaxID=3031114 RepID=UPI0023F9BEBE|nr:DUF6653 family protein [Spongiactinospora sp. TRM90649]MDF5751760.1 hypothetical protein [Spongiactinospora sp. TRM90649]
MAVSSKRSVIRALAKVAAAFRMTDEAWRRHANPWSVWTRFAAIPAMILAVWSRDWIGWWSLVPIAVVIVWLWLNPQVPPRRGVERLAGSPCSAGG